MVAVFDYSDVPLILARLTAVVVSVVGLRLMVLLFKLRRSSGAEHYSPVIFFTTFWLTCLMGINLVAIGLGASVISEGNLRTALAMSYVWSLAGMTWLVYRVLVKCPDQVQRAVVEAVKQITKPNEPKGVDDG